MSFPNPCTRLHSPFERKSSATLDRIECGLIELKFEGVEADEMVFEGYGAVFGNVDSQGDVIAKGAFKNAIREAKASGIWPAMLQQHGGWQMSADDMMPIGVWLDMAEDDVGLKVKGKCAPTVRGREMFTLMKMQPRPAINGLSIGYRPVKWQMQTKPEQPRRTLQEVKLIEISPVTFPSNPKARIQAAKNMTGIRLAEQALRDAGFSSNEAKAIVAKGFSSQPRQRDVGGLGELAAALRQNIDDLS